MYVLLITPADHIVDNCISADSCERAAQFYPHHLCVERQPDSPAGPGWLYDPATGSLSEPPAPPRQPTVLTRLEFLRRIPTPARIAIRQAAATDAVIADGLGLLDLADQVHTADPDVVMLVGYLVQHHYLTAAQAAAILE